MAVKWPVVCLRDLCDAKRGITYGIVQPGSPQKTGVPIIRADDVDDGRISTSNLMRVAPTVEASYLRSRIRGGEVLLTLVGAYFGKSAVTREEHIGFNTARAVGVIPVLHDADFISFALRSPICQLFINERANTTAQPTLNLSDVADIPIPWPREDVRAMVTGIFRALDNKIELCRRMNQTLEAMAQAIFKDWFVDFGPTRAKMEGRAPYLAPEIWSQFPGRLDDERKPEGWNNFRLDDLVVQSKGSVSPSASPNEVFEHYSLPAFDAGKSPALDLGSSIKSNKTPVPSGAVLLSKLNPETSRVWLPDPKAQHTQVASTEFLSFQPKASVGTALVYSLLSSPPFKAMLEGMVTGTSKSHQRISPPALLSQAVLVAAPTLVVAFEQTASSLLARQLANRAQNRTLAAARDLLLPKLMSGEIQLRDAERVLEAVA
jgi:type I restriction enzyme, S subunit